MAYAKLCFLKGAQMAIVAEHLDNAWFNAIAKIYLLESIYIINQEKAPTLMGITPPMLLFFIRDYFALFLLFCDCIDMWLNVYIVCSGWIAV